MPRLLVTCFAVCVSASALIAPSFAQESLYDAQVDTKLELTSAQRPKVNTILATGNKEFRAILAKYKIDINARPNFEKLRKASDELIAHRRKQRSAMAKVLTPEQLDQYDDLIEAAGARVRKAAQ
ncbi:MAG: hypothetical protein AB7S41_00950 [Parvibaculaceae bacterium]